MSADDWMGRNEYARHRGVAPNAVWKAANDGRIAEAVKWDDGRIKAINWRLADELWARHTDPEEAAKSGKAIEQPASDSSSQDPVPDTAGDTAPAAAGKDGPKDPHGFYEGRAKRMRFEALDRELDHLERIGELVSAKETEDEVFAIFRQVRDRLQNIPARIGPRLAAESDPLRVDAMLSEEIVQVLDELSHDVDDLATARAA